jgi:CheY-like chemotaxis protein
MSGDLHFANDHATKQFPSQTPHTPEPQGGARVRNILIVDDSHFERHVIRGAVEALTKYRVCGEAANGVDAIQKALHLRPDLVVMDLAMPLMNGVEAAMVLRNAMPKVPIVLFTLYAEQLRGAISQAFGVTLIVSKMDGLAALLGSLERLLGDDRS